MPPRALRPSRSACGWASNSPGNTERPPRSRSWVVGAAPLSSAASSPTATMRPDRTATACASRDVRSSVMMLPPCRIKSGGGIFRHTFCSAKFDRDRDGQNRLRAVTPSFFRLVLMMAEPWKSCFSSGSRSSYGGHSFSLRMGSFLVWLRCVKVSHAPAGGSSILLYLFEDYVLDTDCRELRRGAVLISVEPKVFDLLVYVIEHPDPLVTQVTLTHPLSAPHTIPHS